MSTRTVRTPTVEFSRRGSAATPEGDVVRVRGVIFRAGHFPEKNFSKTPDELRRDVAEFSPVPIDLGHPSAASPLDGQFGYLESVDLSDDGTTLYGTAALQKWFKDKLGDAKLRVSATWDRATKRMRSLSVVTHPHIEEAELQAAFACACGGHDAATTTTTTKEDPPMGDENVNTNATDRKARALALVEEMDEDDLAVMLGEDEPDTGTDDDGGATSDFAADEAAALRAEVEELKAERREEKAAAFAKQMVHEDRITPADEDDARLAMFAALSDDALLGTAVHFSQAGRTVSGTREQMVRASYAKRAPHGFRKPAIHGRAEFSVLDNGGETAETPEQKRARLDARLKNTNTGQAILARRNGNARV